MLKKDTENKCMLISAVHLYFRLKNPSEEKEDSLGRLQTKVQSRRTWGYSKEAWGVWALGTQGWKPLGLKTPANILPATPSFSCFHWLIRFESRAQKKLVSVLLGAHILCKLWPLCDSLGLLASWHTEGNKSPSWGRLWKHNEQWGKQREWVEMSALKMKAKPLFSIMQKSGQIKRLL